MATASEPGDPDPAGWALPAFARTDLAPKRTGYCVCVPVRNEGERIGLQLDAMARARVADAADILILDGASTDGSVLPERLREAGVRMLLVQKGAGHLSASLRMGYAVALLEGYRGVITVDGNNKDGVDAIPRFVAALEDGWDFVQGSRFVPGGQAENTPLSRLLAMRLLHIPLISLAARFRFTDTTNGFRGYSRRLLLDPRIQPFRDVFETYELLAYMSVRAPRCGFRVCEIPVSRKYPKGAVPTKISRVRGSLELIGILAAAVTGKFAPRTPG